MLASVTRLNFWLSPCMVRGEEDQEEERTEGEWCGVWEEGVGLRIEEGAMVSGRRDL